MSRSMFVWNFMAVLTMGSMVGGADALAEAPEPSWKRFSELKHEAHAIHWKFQSNNGSDLEAHREQVAALERKAKAAGATAEMADQFKMLADQFAVITRHRSQLEMQKQHDRIRSRAVMTRFPGKYTLEDSINLDKVSAAFAESDLKDFVVTTQPTNEFDRHRYWPVVHNYNRYTAVGPADDPVLKWIIDAYKQYGVGSPPELAAGMVGLVWTSLRDQDIVVVTIDGGRYRGRIVGVVNGIGKPDAWPSPFAFTNLDPRDITVLANAGQLSKERRNEWNAVNKGARACSNKYWDAWEPKFAAIRVANISERTRDNRFAALNAKAEKQWDTRCTAWKKKAKAAWKAAIADRTLARRTAFERNKAKLIERIAAQKVASGQ
ncbi:MAG: hypothetical protein HYY84_13320 [Deltaproteobacteria bacterium]|nr:hypothetical protein [Deltaproteobacteria bacterium]